MGESEDTKTCGIVMPISSIGTYSESHWADVLSILSDCIEKAGFEANLVSNADEVGIIQKTIVQNLYDNPMIVCDVSAKNPNVMFELGMRLAFDKPTIIVKDDATAYSFDTSPIEHLEYPRDLRFGKIVDFKKRPTAKIAGTAKKAIDDPNYSTFLKNFGEFKVAQLDHKLVPLDEIIIEEIRGIQSSIRRLEARESKSHRYQRAHISNTTPPYDLTLIVYKQDIENFDGKIKDIAAYSGVKNIYSTQDRDIGYILFLDLRDGANVPDLLFRIQEHLGLAPDDFYVNFA